ncbi:unnamed protein product [Mesocestoides corti]|nr:unnamed protein product [Mesocestoides corti]
MTLQSQGVCESPILVPANRFPPIPAVGLGSKLTIHMWGVSPPPAKHDMTAVAGHPTPALPVRPSLAGGTACVALYLRVL